MRKILMTALIAATALPTLAVPTVASAQSRGEVRDSARDLREERRDLQRAYRYGDRRDIRDERKDVRRAEREYAKDLRDYRRANSSRYRRGEWRAPFRYQRWNEGARIGRNYYDSRYAVRDPGYYRLPRVRNYMRYVRHYDDVLLVNLRTGRIVRVYHNFFW